MPVRNIVEELKYKGYSQSEISRIVGVSRARVHQIIVKKNEQIEPVKEHRLLSTNDVASLLNVHANTIRRWSNNGLLKTYRLGPRGDRRFMKEDVLKMLE